MGSEDESNTNLTFVHGHMNQGRDSYVKGGVGVFRALASLQSLPRLNALFLALYGRLFCCFASAGGIKVLPSSPYMYKGIVLNIRRLYTCWRKQPAARTHLVRA